MGLEEHIRFGNYQKSYCGLIFLALICTETTWGSTLQFLLLKVAGLLRVSAEVEEKGLDDSKHGGAAYQAGSSY